MRRVPIDRGQWLGTAVAAQTLLAPLFDGLRSESCLIVHLDDALRALSLFAIDGIGEGRVDLPLRAIMAEALAGDARALILAHNHPDGDPSPSRADKDATRRLAEIAAPWSIALLDHLIFAGARWVSFRALGLL